MSTNMLVSNFVLLCKISLAVYVLLGAVQGQGYSSEFFNCLPWFYNECHWYFEIDNIEYLDSVNSSDILPLWSLLVF